MKIRSVKQDELDYLKSFVEYKEFFETNNIWLEQSKVCFADNGDLLGFALVRPNSLIDFFNGVLPPDNSVEENRKWRKKMRIEYYVNKHYEVVFFFKSIGDKYINSDGLSDSYLQFLVSHEIEEYEDGDLVDGLFWTLKVPEYVVSFKSYNDVVYTDIMPIDQKEKYPQYNENNKKS